MNTLIITLPPGSATSATVFDYVQSQDGQTALAHSRCAAALLPALGNGAGEIVARIPAALLSWQRVTLPKNTLNKNLLSEAGSPRVRAVLDGLLEERVLDDTALLHFALAPDARAEQPAWVAVCDRQWLRTMLQLLEQAGRTVTRIVPECEPDAALAQLVVVGESEQPQLLLSGVDAVRLLPCSAVGLALADWPADQVIWAQPAVAAQAEALFGRPVQVVQAAQRALLSAQSPWDLAQFDLLASGSARFWKRNSRVASELLAAPRWRAARWAAVVMAGVNLVALNVWAWKEQGALRAKQQAVQATLTGTFAQVKVVVDAPVQMAREVDVLRRAAGASSGGDFESALAAMGPLVATVGSASAIEYEAGETRIRFGSGDLEAAKKMGAQIVAPLKSAGFETQRVGDKWVLRKAAVP